MLFGVGLTYLISFKGGWLERLGLSFLLGTGTLSIIFFVYIWITNRVSSRDFWLIVVALILLLFIFKRPSVFLKKIEVSKMAVRFNFVSVFCWAVILTLFATSIVNAVYRPVYTTDSLILFDFRSKAMFVSQKLTSIQDITGWQNYPMFTSMIGLISRFLGIDNPSFYYPVMYLSFSILFYSILIKATNKNIASIGTLLMYTTPITLWQSQLDGMTNIPYTIFLCLSVFYIYKVLISKKDNFVDVIISSLFLGLATWTRAAEPLWVVPIFLVTSISFVKKKLMNLCVYLIIFYPISKLWPTYEGWQYSSFGAVGKILIDAALNSPDNGKLFSVRLTHVFNSMLAFSSENMGPILLIFVIFIVSDMVFLKSYRDQIFYLLTVTGLLIIIFVGSLFMTINYGFEVNIDNGSLSRLLSIFPPLMWFCITISPAWILGIKSLKLNSLFEDK
jgi:hypothetical protein